ncbi:MAG: hypothetical protein ACM3VW_10085, partial [Bacteroidota bacterium]
PVVWDTVKALLDDPNAILEQLSLEEDAREQRAANSPHIARAAEKRLAQLEAEEMQVVRLFRAGKITEQLLDAQLQEIAAEKAVASAELQAASAAQQAEADLIDLRDTVSEFCLDMRDGLEHLQGEEKQQVLRLLVDRIEVDPDGDHGKLHLMFPVSSANTGLLPHCQARA